MIKRIFFLCLLLIFTTPISIAEEMIFITNVNVNDFSNPYVKVYSDTVPTTINLYNYSESFIVSNDSTTYIYIQPHEIELLNSQNLYQNIFSSHKYLIIFFILICVIVGFGLYIIKIIGKR